MAATPGRVFEYYPASLRERYAIGDENGVKPSVDAPKAIIDWLPIYDEYKARAAARLAAGGLATEVPEGYPRQLTGPLVWTGKDFETRDFVVELSHDDKAELLQALAHFQGLDLDISQTSRENFPLPKLGKTLDELCLLIHQGRGFFVLRGLEADDFTPVERAILYLGISSYIAGRRGRQNQDGSMFTHVMDMTDSKGAPPNPRSVYSNMALPFHADVICDVLALWCIRAAPEGGKSLLAPAWTIYNELAASRPDLLHTLAQDDWVHDTFGRYPAYHRRALLHVADGKPILNFSRRIITGSPETPRTPGIPAVTEAQAEALDAVHYHAVDHALEFSLASGDMLFVNNLAILHSREEFVDAAHARRYLLRLWLNNPDRGWEIPPGLELPWDRVFAPLPEIRNRWVADPFAEDGSVLELRLNRSSSCG